MRQAPAEVDHHIREYPKAPLPPQSLARRVDGSSRTLRSMPIGARVNVHLPGLGYVGVGETIGQAQRFDEARVLIGDEWVPLADQTLRTPHGDGDPVAEETAEYVVPGRWVAAAQKAEAYWVKGMFANQNRACKLRDTFTLGRLAEHFDRDD